MIKTFTPLIAIASLAAFAFFAFAFFATALATGRIVPTTVVGALVSILVYCGALIVAIFG